MLSKTTYFEIKDSKSTNHHGMCNARRRQSFISQKFPLLFHLDRQEYKNTCSFFHCPTIPKVVKHTQNLSIPLCKLEDSSTENYRLVR